MIPYLLLADGQNTILAALFMFSGRVIYPYYASTPRIAGFTPLGDQIVAGAIMWVPGSIFYLVPAALIMFQMLSPQNLSSPLRVSSPLPNGERSRRFGAGEGPYSARELFARAQDSDSDLL